MSDATFGDFGRKDKYAPNSDLDADISFEKTYTIMDGKTVSVAPNDWLDVEETAMPADPFWGYSFQVHSTELDDAFIIKAYDVAGDFYDLVTLSASYVSNVYRRMPTIDPVMEE